MENFKWDDNLVKEFIRDSFDRNYHGYLSAAMEQFKKSKEHQKERLSTLNRFFKIGHLPPKEVEEKKDYEILSYRNTKNIAKGDLSEIYSVRRLSDGEFFKIGDRVTNGYSNFVINKITVHGEVWINEPHEILKNINHVKALFTTEDGVDIYEGDKVFMLHTVTWRVAPSVPAPKTPFTDGGIIKYFSTKEAASEYILMNKPVLCLKDLLGIVSGVSMTYHEIEELAKSKI